MVMYGPAPLDHSHMWPLPAANATTTTAVAPAAYSQPSQFIFKDGRKIRVGDCALFKPQQDSPPFIGIIRKLTLTLNKDESPSLQVNWLYRPADLKVAKGILLEAAPNEVFYSFHKDETPAASLLHPCKVAFLRKGVELPSGISAFVCRRVYDIDHKCLWWLTDKDYLNERQEEVDQLIDKTKLEMHGAVQSGGRSPSPLNGPTSTASLKAGSDSIQNSSSFVSQGKGKKRERGDQGSDLSKREWLTKTEDGDSGQFRLESMLKSEIAKITDKGGLVDFEGVERLIQLMRANIADKKIDLAGRIMLVNVISFTERYDCLGWFVQLKGLPVLDEWLQELHKGKIGDGNMPKESDKSVEEFLLALLCALDKLPVNLHALQTCNVGKSVNHLRSHKNSEIQKKARSLVDTWKKRVEVEMNMNDGKSGSSRAVSWQAKPAPSYVSQVGNKKTGGSSEIAAKSSGMHPLESRNSQAKLSSGEALSKYSPSPGSTRSVTTSVVSNSKDQNIKMVVGSGTSDLPLSSIKEERSSSSSHSQNNSLSCSSEHPKTTGSCMEDARSSTAVSMNVNKIPGGASRTRKSSNGLHVAGVTVFQKEPHSGKNSNRNSPSEKVSSSQVSHENIPDLPLADQGNNQRLILRLPNIGHSPARGVSGATFDEAVSCGKASPPADKNENQDRRVKAKTDGTLSNIPSSLTTDACDANEAFIGYEEGNGSPRCNERCRFSEDGDKMAESSKPTRSLLEFVSRSGQTYDASLSPMNALVESCVKFSEASASVSPGDDGMNLLATVAAGEISRSENVSPLVSPQRKSPAADESSSGNDGKSKHSSEAVACALGQFDSGASGEHMNNVDPFQFKNHTRHPVTTMSCDLSGDGEASSSSYIEKTDDGRTQMKFSSTGFLQNAEGPCLHPETIEDASEPGEKETHAEPGGENQFHGQRELAKSSNNSESKLKSRTSSFDEEQKVEHKDEGAMENEKVLVAGESVKIEKEVSEKSPEFSSDVGNENQIIAEKVMDAGISVPTPSPVAENCVSKEIKREPRAENVDDMKSGEIEPDEKRVDLDSSVSACINECAEENLGRKEVLGHCFNSAGNSESPRIPVQENELLKTSECNLDAIESEGAGVNASLPAFGSDTAVKLDFDLNEGFPVDDVSQGEIVRPEEPITSSAVHIPTPLTFPISSVSRGFHASITVASAAKGPVIPPENPLRSKGELGWKGSAATSAFRPAEPRKNADPLSNTIGIPSVDAAALKQGRPLDFDLNVPDQRSFEDVTSLGSSGQTHLDAGAHDCSTVGLDLDLNRIDETPETGSFSMRKLDTTTLPSKPSLSGGLSNGGSGSRDFDLNNGPGLDEVGSEVPARSQQMKSAVSFPSAVYGVRTNNTESGNYSSWFPSGNSFSAITVPPLLPGRGEQSYVTGAGAQQILGPPGSTSFGPEIYRGPVLSSSPAVAFPPTSVFPYPGFPFETNFSLSSNSFSGSTTFMDSSAVGGLCFPNMPSQPVGPGGVVPSPYPHPYIMSLPGGTSNMMPENRKWGSQSLDLNSGPGGTDTERRDDRLPSGLRQLSVPNSQALMEEQMKMLQVAGSVLKRKEPDGGWDGADRFSYKQPSWQ